jgi:hypothetical protein
MDLFDITAPSETVPVKSSFLSAPLCVEPSNKNNSVLPPIEVLSGHQAASREDAVRLVSQIFNESFGYRPDGRQYRLGPKSTDFFFIGGGAGSGVGYLFGKEIPSSMGRIAWIESMAVLPLYRNQGVATSLLQAFSQSTKAAPRLGCATPNPIAALVVSRVIVGKMFVGKCGTPYRLVQLLKDIRQDCFDLRGCSIDESSLIIRTGFSPLSRSDQREWRPRNSRQKPAWWNGIENLPNEYEALLIIERPS